MSPSEWVALVSLLVTILAGFGTLFLQTRTKRRDDERAAQLDRLNRQLSQLYGPLYALYEAGERNWMLFVYHFSGDSRPLATRTFLPSSSDRFPPPDGDRLAEYRRRMEQLFMPTNVKMESLIVEHADLLVGTKMPDEFSDFLAHVAAAKLLMHRWQTDPGAFGLDRWPQHQVEYPHPTELKHRIRASFEALKSTQRQLLAGLLDSVDEVKLERRIEARIEELADEWNRQGPSYAGRFRNAPLQAA